MESFFVARFKMNSVVYFPHHFCPIFTSSHFNSCTGATSSSSLHPYLRARIFLRKVLSSSNPIWSQTFSGKHLKATLGGKGKKKKKKSKGTLFWPKIRCLIAEVIKTGKKKKKRMGGSLTIQNYEPLMTGDSVN